MTSPTPPHARSAPSARRVGAATTARNDTGSTAALELMSLTPVCVLLVVLISWAGNSAQAQLATSLAAQEAATAAALCCRAPRDAPSAGGLDDDTARRLAAEAVIASRPSLAHLCLSGPQPADGRRDWITHTTAPLRAPRHTHGPHDPRGTRLPESGPATAEPETNALVQVTTVHITCVTDGVAAPLRGLFGTRIVHGHGTRITHTTNRTEEPAADIGAP